MERDTKPGMPCPFTNAECQPGCWLWDMEGTPGECGAWRELQIGSEQPRDFYNRCVMEALR